MNNFQAVLIGGTGSGCGKTTVSLALMAALKLQALSIQPFKVGPDYLDPGLHSAVCKKASYNLDSWMCSQEHIQALFAKAASSDWAITEGVMGLFDGSSGYNENGSSSQIAKWLNLPIILVLNAKGMSRSIRAMAQGYLDFQPDLNFAGLICTQTGSLNHVQLIQEALSDLPIPLLGCLPYAEEARLPSRHLGLLQAEEFGLKSAILGTWFSKHIDMQVLTKRCHYKRPNSIISAPHPKTNVRIGIAKDEAFSFIYPATIDAFEAQGVELIYFSPLHDAKIPECDGLWLCGGYPELYVEKLSQNYSLLDSLRNFSTTGKPIHAECGAYIWLMQEFEVNGQNYPLAGLIPAKARLGEKRAALGYRSLKLLHSGCLGQAQDMLKGHEFHYSYIIEQTEQHKLWQPYDRNQQALEPEGWQKDKLSASWIHIYPEAHIIKNFIYACQNIKYNCATVLK